MRSLVIAVLLLISIFMTSLSAQSLDVSIAPILGSLSPSSDQLSGYYDSNSIFTLGGEVSVLTDFYDLGLYFNILSTKVTVDDPNEIGGPITEKAIITSLGLIKRFDLDILSIDIKAGLSMHSDKLQFNTDENRIGFRIGSEISKKFYGPFSAHLGVAYDYEELSVPVYETFAYSRKCSYLSGQQFNTGGIFYYAGLSYNLYHL